MKAVSVRQPWAELIISGGKRYELRSWRTSFRGRLWIQASAAVNNEEISLAGLDARALVFGAIVGYAQVVDCLPFSPDIADELIAAGSYFGAWRPSWHAWKVVGPYRLPEPVPMRGRLGLFDVPEPLAERARLQIPDTNTYSETSRGPLSQVGQKRPNVVDMLAERNPP